MQRAVAAAKVIPSRFSPSINSLFKLRRVKGCNSSERVYWVRSARALVCLRSRFWSAPPAQTALSFVLHNLAKSCIHSGWRARVLFFSADRTRTNFTRPSCPPQKLRWIGQKAAGQLFRAGQIMRWGRFNKAAPCAESLFVAQIASACAFRQLDSFIIAMKCFRWMCSRFSSAIHPTVCKQGFISLLVRRCGITLPSSFASKEEKQVVDECARET